MVTTVLLVVSLFAMLAMCIADRLQKREIKHLRKLHEELIERQMKADSAAFIEIDALLSGLRAMRDQYKMVLHAYRAAECELKVALSKRSGPLSAAQSKVEEIEAKFKLVSQGFSTGNQDINVTLKSQ